VYKYDVNLSPLVFFPDVADGWAKFSVHRDRDLILVRQIVGHATEELTVLTAERKYVKPQMSDKSDKSDKLDKISSIKRNAEMFDIKYENYF